MKIVDMCMICRSCCYYRAISYADGSSSIGCIKASDTLGMPVDIRKLDTCPKSHGRRQRESIPAGELLKVLGHLYARTSASAAYISLYKVLDEAGDILAKRKQVIAQAIQQLDILTVVAKSVEGLKGRRCIYRWNMKKHGPPSLELVDKVNRHIEDLLDAAAIARKRQDCKAPEVISIQNIRVIEGVTSCENCWLKEVKDCRTQLLSFGIDCKKVNVNSMKHENAMGFTTKG